MPEVGPGELGKWGGPGGPGNVCAERCTMWKLMQLGTGEMISTPSDNNHNVSEGCAAEPTPYASRQQRLVPLEIGPVREVGITKPVALKWTREPSTAELPPQPWAKE